MLLHKTRNLDESLIRLLVRKPCQSARALHEQIVRGGRVCSIQGVYHELRKLQRLGSVVKVGEKFSLSFLWIEDLADIAYSVQRNYIQNLTALLELPSCGCKKRWRFNDVLRMDAMYMQLTLALRRQVHNTPAFEWCPAAWYTLVQEDIERKFKAAMHASQQELYVILGGTSKIEWDWVKTRTSKLIHYARGDTNTRREPHRYITTIGPYVLQAEISKELARHLEKILTESATCAEGGVKLRRLLMSRRWPCSVTVEHSEQRALKLQRRYRRYFV